MMHKSLMLLRRGAQCNGFSRSSVKFQGHTAERIVDFDLLDLCMVANLVLYRSELFLTF